MGWGILNTIQLERRGEPMMNDKTHNGEGGGILMRNITYLIKILKKTEGMLSSKRGGREKGIKRL